MNETTRAALGVQPGEHGANDAVLAGRIEALQNEQETARALGVEALVKDREPLVELGE